MNKKSRRCIAIGIGFCILPLSACMDSCFEELPAAWFSAELLAEYGVENLPSPLIENGRLREITTTKQRFYFNATHDEIQELAKQIVDYLSANEKVYHLCVYDSHGGLVAEMLPYDNYLPVTDEFIFNESAYTFAYSLSAELDDYDGGYLPALHDPILIGLGLHEKDVVQQGPFLPAFEYNATVTIQKQGWGVCAILYEEE